MECTPPQEYLPPTPGGFLGLYSPTSNGQNRPIQIVLQHQELSLTNRRLKRPPYKVPTGLPELQVPQSQGVAPLAFDMSSTKLKDRAVSGDTACMCELYLKGPGLQICRRSSRPVDAQRAGQTESRYSRCFALSSLVQTASRSQIHGRGSEILPSLSARREAPSSIRQRGSLVHAGTCLRS